MIGFHASAWGSDHLLNACSSLAMNGFDGIEVYGDVSQIFADKPGEFRTLLGIAGVGFAGVSGGGPLCFPEYHEAEQLEWQRLIQWAAAAEAKYVVYYGGEGTDDPVADLAHGAHLLNELGAHAREHGLLFCYEPDPGSPFNSHDAITSLLDNTSAEDVYLSADTARLDAIGLDPVFFTLTQHARIGVVHLRDVQTDAESTPEEADPYVDPGAGRLDLHGVADALHSVGFSNWVVSVVDQPRVSARASANATATFLRERLEFRF